MCKSENCCGRCSGKTDSTGLYNKYKIMRTDGKPIAPDAKYFVLRYDDGVKRLDYLRAAKIALRAYAEAIERANQKLAQDILNDCGEFD